ncbi:DUF1152 domain-containing protein [Streptomyces venezuelae]|uniref:DUF1152 domain-containing protein n=1 Tax=Streptomyces venezuelae TaxID=54571 RepID=A0A5P2BPC1_STRVZ|nr:DUF1152 domain-containing protein [Streptomyces venezuelae]QES32325.1 hypothetical protein DEJ48_01895 [Streptomyces venezuelae]
MTNLLIAAGGGGDVITTTAVHAALHGVGSPALVLTYAWERLTVDPVPGPRRASDFTDTVAAGSVLRLLTPASAPVPPAGSSLPRLAADLPVRLGLLDPYDGAVGLARQVEEAAAYCGATRIDIVDVGGDILTDGTEPTLRSPLGDALVLAACAGTGLPARVHVAGPGLDCEIPEKDVLRRLEGTPPAMTLTPRHTGVVEHVFDWHPSEASALVAAAAHGVRGVCGIRDAPQPVPLTDTGACVYRLPLARALALNPLARALRDTTALARAEDVSRRVCGFSEIARERERARTGTWRDPASGTQRARGSRTTLADRFTHWSAQIAGHGIQYVTTRRVREELDLTADEFSRLRDQQRHGRTGDAGSPLWRVEQ